MDMRMHKELEGQVETNVSRAATGSNLNVEVAVQETGRAAGTVRRDLALRAPNAYPVAGMAAGAQSPQEAQAPDLRMTASLQVSGQQASMQQDSARQVPTQQARRQETPKPITGPALRAKVRAYASTGIQLLMHYGKIAALVMPPAWAVVQGGEWAYKKFFGNAPPEMPAIMTLTVRDDMVRSVAEAQRDIDSALPSARILMVLSERGKDSPILSDRGIEMLRTGGYDLCVSSMEAKGLPAAIDAHSVAMTCAAEQLGIGATEGAGTFDRPVHTNLESFRAHVADIYAMGRFVARGGSPAQIAEAMSLRAVYGAQTDPAALTVSGIRDAAEIMIREGRKVHGEDPAESLERAISIARSRSLTEAALKAIRQVTAANRSGVVPIPETPPRDLAAPSTKHEPLSDNTGSLRQDHDRQLPKQQEKETVPADRPVRRLDSMSL